MLARRLSNAEYDYTVRDLTGVDMKPTREFPSDPANSAGFDNSGESLHMSPALLNKYLKAAHDIAGHMVLKPKGFAFADSMMLSDSDRDRYCVHRIIDFYHRQNTDYLDYFAAAWRFKHRRSLGMPERHARRRRSRQPRQPEVPGDPVGHVRGHDGLGWTDRQGAGAVAIPPGAGTGWKRYGYRRARGAP